MELGPVQVLVLAFEKANFTGEIMRELTRLREHDVVRLVGLLFVRKDEDGSIEELETTDLSPEELTSLGELAGALIGLGAGGEEGAAIGAAEGAHRTEDGSVFDEEQVWYLADQIPPGVATAVVVLEHRWAIPLRDAVVRAGGTAVSDEWIHPWDLVRMGFDARTAAST
ncbi:MAG: hypothetical protein ACRDYU_14320 [Actinomycetes bacterium]